jgi:hypothetical protein
MTEPLFEHVASIKARIPEKQQTWPQGPNLMFAAAARQVAECYRMPWLWFEPDAVPIKPGWLDGIAAAYWRCPKRFMGSLVPADNQPDMPPVHLAGCAVYPPDAFAVMEQFTKGNVAFDIAAAGYTVPRAVNCPLMQHFWGQPDASPTFTTETQAPPNSVTLDFIHPVSLMFHRTKDGSLIDLLREKANSRPMTAGVQHQTSAQEQEFAPVKRGPGRPRKMPESPPAQIDPALELT